MDYGKLAYLKVEDLERAYGRRGEAFEEFRGGRYCFCVGRRLDGEYYLTDVSSTRGSVCLILKMTCSADSAGFVDVLLGSSPCSRIAVEAAGSKEYIALVQSSLNGFSPLSIRASGTHIANVEIMVIGGEATANGRQITGDVSNDGEVLAFACEDEIITQFSGREGEIDFAAGRVEAVGAACDAACLGGEFYVVLLDIYGNLWLKKQGGSYRHIASGFCNSASISASDSGICIAAIKEESVEFIDLDSIFDKPTQTKIPSSNGAGKTTLAKATTTPKLAITTKKAGSYFIRAEQESKAKMKLRVEVRA